jgi:glycerophosphoryl diester phosphodiesterase
MRILFYCLISLVLLTCKNQTSIPEVEPSQLLTTFRYTNNKSPKISVHRGGKGIENYPENCLETLQYVNDSIIGIYEIDVARTKDGKLVLLHDNSIDRTTTGTGLVKDLEYDQLKNFNLIDDFGNETGFKIPLFTDVLRWSKANNVVLSIDIKKSVPQKEVIDAIKAEKAEDTSMVITYGLEQSISAYKRAPELLISVSARNDEELDKLLNSGIPTKNMIAFTGTRLSDASLFKRLHDNDILTMLGTLGNLDKSAQVRGDNLYNDWMALGADMIATDRPFAVAKAINNK